MKGTKLIATVFLVVGVTFMGCLKEVDYYDQTTNCPPFVGDYFDIKGIKEVAHWAVDANGDRFELTEYSSVSISDYTGFSITYELDYVSARKEAGFNRGFSNLYAFSCDENGVLGSKSEALHDITIITEHNFSSDYLKGDTINEIMLINGGEVSKYLNYVQQDTIADRWLGSFKPKMKPTLNSNFKVRLIVELSTGEKHEVITPMIVLN